MNSELHLSRRALVKSGVAGGVGLVVACRVRNLSNANVNQASAAVDSTFGMFVVVTSDDQVKLVFANQEVGQGLLTGQIMWVAEELNTEPSMIGFELAGLGSSRMKASAGFTGGSAGMSVYKSLQNAAAAAREVLIAAAAQDWGVSPTECTVENKKVKHSASARSASFGSLAARAAALPFPSSPAIKSPGQYRFIGKPIARVEATAKVNGTAQFGIDTKVEGALIATMVHCPHYGGTAKSFNEAEVKAMPGVVDVFDTAYGVAVVAKSTHEAFSGARKLQVAWSPAPTTTSAEILTQQKQLAQQVGKEQQATGNAPNTFNSAAKKVESVYDVPYLPHSCLEPQNCTVAPLADGTWEVWAPTQAPPTALSVAAQNLGVSTDKVKLHTTLIGGAFGRRLSNDYVAEACIIAKKTARPVKLIWTRREEFVRDFYRPSSVSHFKAGLDAQGKIVSWNHHIVSALISAWKVSKPPKLATASGGTEPSALEGAIGHYSIPNFRVAFTQHEAGVPVFYWRSVGHSQNTFAVESFMDELATAAGKDPVAFRLAHLPPDHKLRAPLALAVEKSGWNAPAAPGTARGVAICASFGSAVAQVIEVEKVDDSYRVKKVTCAIDCGLVVNPMLVTQQMHSAIIQGLSAAMKQKITIAAGAAVETSFESCGLLRCNETPDIQVHFVPSTSTEPSGVGEPGLPPTAPALCNALFALTRKRIRSLPVPESLT